MARFPTQIGDGFRPFAWLIRWIVLLSGCMGLVLAAPAQAQEDTVPMGWVSPSGPGGVYGSAAAACYAQWQAHMDNGFSRFIGARPYQDDWRYQKCEWTRYQYLCPEENPGAGFLCRTILPDYVKIGCPANYTPTVDDFCRLNPARERPQCNDDAGRPNPPVGKPVLLSTGAKVLDALDYETADGLFRIGRQYRSFQVGRPIKTSVLPRALQRGLAGGWNFTFNREIQLGDFSGSPSSPDATVAILLPDGSGYGFVLQSNGTWIEDPSAGTASHSCNLKLEFVGTLPSDLSTIRDTASTWKLTDKNDTVWTLRTRAGPNGGPRVTGWPISMVTRSGYAQTFAYNSDSSLASITDSFGRVATFEWNMFNITTLSSPPAGSLAQPGSVKSITLPDGTSLKYSYATTDPPLVLGGTRVFTGGSGTGSSSVLSIVAPRPSHLGKVERRSATNAVLDSVTYLHGDLDYPRNITGIIDHRGVQVASYTYDSAARVIVTQGADGTNKKTVAYGANGTARTRTVTNELGKAETYTYSLYSSGAADYRLTSIAGAASANTAAGTTSISYGSNTFVSTMTDGEGNVTATTRDSRGRPTSISEADGTGDEITTTIAWHSTFNVPVTITRPGLTETRTYYSNGQLETVTLEDTTSQSVPYSTNGQTRTVTYTWDANGRLLSENGPLAAAGADDDLTVYDYDTSGNLLTATNALGHVITYDDYDENGRPGTVTDPNGVDTVFTYDLLGQVETITVEHPSNPSLNAVTTIAYDEAGNVTEITLPATDTLLMDYDNANRLVTMRAASGERIDYTYDKMGNVTSQTVKSAGGLLSSRFASKFDELGRLIRSTAGTNSHAAEWSYDKVGNVTGAATPNGHETTSAFDALNRVISTVAPDGGETGFDYDARGNLADFTDPIEVTTGFVYNGFGDLIQEVSPDRGTSTYVYDAAGRVIEATDGRGQTIEYTRDFLGRVTESAPVGLSGETVTYTWDTGGLSGSYEIGRLGKVEDASGTTGFKYDHRGNLLAQQQTIGSTSAAQLAYTYDTADRITQIAYPSGRLVKYSYDSKGRVSAVETKAQSSDPSWTVVANSYSYEAFGPVTAMALGNGLAVQKTFGTDGLLTSSRLYDTSNSTSLSHLTYRHDANGNIGAIVDQLDDANSVLFGYDNMDRLQLAVAANAGTPASYGYTGGTNQLASVTDAGGTRTIAYDNRGNTESETRPGSIDAALEYDGYGRLTAYARTDLGTASFVYNGLDDRVTMSLPTAGTRRFVYDPSGRVMGEYGASASDIQAEFIWMLPEVGASGTFGGDDGLGGYMPLAVATPDASSAIQLNWIHADHLGTPIIATDALGDPATTPDDYLAAAFPGQSRMFADLYYNRYRDYDPTTGRYVQADPIGLGGGSNPFLYVNGNPINAIDPLGLFDTRDAWGFVPFVGPVLDAWDAYQCGNYWWATFHVGMALTDLTGGGAFIKGGARAFGGKLRPFLKELAEDVGGGVPRMGKPPVGAKPLGDWGEANLADLLDNQGFKPTKPFLTPMGPRYPDRLLNDIAHESKAGVNVKLTSQIARQIAKDAELIRSGTYDGAVWHFWQGATPELLQALRDAGIQFIVH